MGPGLIRLKKVHKNELNQIEISIAGNDKGEDKTLYLRVPSKGTIIFFIV